jgi:RimJ/RimL family protein N-acetyltransferase
VRVETARLVIRTFEPQDAEPWLAMVNDPEVRRFLPPGPVRTMETFQGAIERRQMLERERGYAMWAVEIKASGVFIGQCGFQPIEGTEPEVELAYHFNKASWGSGYATEAAMAVLAYGLEPVGLARVIALVVPENIGSWRVLEKIGMRYEGLADYHDMPGLKKYAAESEWWGPAAAS